MHRITDASQLRELLGRPWPRAAVDRAFGRDPELSCWVAAESLAQVLRHHTGPEALVWRGATVQYDAGAAARARLRACLRAVGSEQPFFDGERKAWLGSLPAGVLDRLLQAADEAAGYRPSVPPSGPPAAADDGYATGGVWVAGLLPMAPEAALCVAGYDFAALVASEAAASVTVPGGGEVRVDLLAWPALIAGSLRCAEGWGAPPLLDEGLARQLPCGACRTIVELADAQSEMGGPAAATRFLDDRAGPQPDGTVPLAAAANGPLPQ